MKFCSASMATLLTYSKTKNSKPYKILVVGQTPPPYHGQAIMIHNLLNTHSDHLEWFHVRMEFSSDMDEVGKFKIKKLWVLLKLIAKIYVFKLIHNVDVMYYPPAGPQKIPVYRDIIVLTATRWLFKKVVFHFHAAGVSEIHGTLSGFMRKLYQKAYFYPDVAIRLSEHNPEDGRFFMARKEYLIPCGIEDQGKDYLDLRSKETHSCVNILFVGVLTESKGVLVLLNSCLLLAQKQLDFHCYFMGGFESPAFQAKVENVIRCHGLEDRITFLGIQSGKDKIGSFVKADIVCLPTFYESESFGLVLLEAMQFQLPVIATRWRGIPSIVEDRRSGFLIPINDPEALAEKLEILIRNEPLRQKMGAAGRQLYCQKFTAQRHYQQMEQMFSDLFVDPQSCLEQ